MTPATLVLEREAAAMTSEQRLIEMCDPDGHPVPGDRIWHDGGPWLVTAVERAGARMAVWGVPVTDDAT